MVMEAPPSPDSVGREFVRQYYTLLNKAPAHLHRFYNHQSSFIHGGLDPPRETSPMIGQKQIHQKIQQLNFRDCHAKIAQVDSQATLGDGVVVQVTGELSNAGQPMRRFTQTFVLGAQSPKKYYVHNDIFRYQDEIISDEECEPETRSDVEDEVNQERPALPEMQQITQQPMPFFNSNPPPIQSNLPPMSHHHAQPQPLVMAPQPQSNSVPTVNGAIHPDDLNIMQPQVPQPPSMVAPLNTLQPSLPQPPISIPVSVEERSQLSQDDDVIGDVPVENVYTDEPLVENEVQETVQEPPVSNEPKTYATLLKSGNSASGYGTSNSQIISAPQQTLLQSSSPPPSQSRYDNRDLHANSQSNQNVQTLGGPRNNINRNNIRGNQPRPPRSDNRGNHIRMNTNEDGNMFEDRRRSQGSNFHDMNQLFLGNIPHNATEPELREIFIQFGSIADLRILSKSLNKTGPSNGKIPPNYGFITYETQQGMQNCLLAKPIYYIMNDKSTVQLNIEEKKAKDRQFSSGGGRGNGENNGGTMRSGRDRDNGQPRRGPGGLNNRNGGPGGPPAAGLNNRPGGGGNFNRGGGPPNRGGPNTNNTYNNNRR